MSNWYIEEEASDGSVTVRRVDLNIESRDLLADRWMLKHEEGGMQVSTVFLALDHAYQSNVPVLYETLVFGGPLDQEQVRYSTRAEAIKGHARMIEKVRDTLAGALRT